MIEAKPTTSDTSHELNAADRVARSSDAFSAAARAEIQGWRDRLGNFAGTAVIWGAGSKGITFANMLGSAAGPLVAFVDLNPRKHTVDLPGMRSDDVEVTFEDGTLTIRGQREFAREENEGQYHRIERSYGSFARSVRLPRVAEAERIEASFDNGVLAVLVPKREEAKARTIEVSAK
jgi:HSP20 family protein